jgi:F-type H+-transporting ATPase subunit gamma
MAKAKEILKRRKAVQSTVRITRTMEMISTARFKKAYDRAIATRPYRNKLTDMLQVLAPACEGITHPLLERRPDPKRVSVLVVTANRGLCGGYNSSVLRLAQEYATGWRDRDVNVDLHVSGKRGISFMQYVGWDMTGTYTDFSDRPTYDAVTEVTNELMHAYERGDTDCVAVLYTEFQSMTRQRPRVDQVLPIERLGGEEDQNAPGGDVIFDPDPQSILAELLPLYVRTAFFSAYLDANVSEHLARMRAMKAATDAGEDMITQLTRKYNRARQTQITNEIAEIVGGAAGM